MQLENPIIIIGISPIEREQVLVYSTWTIMNGYCNSLLPVLTEQDVKQESTFIDSGSGVISEGILSFLQTRLIAILSKDQDLFTQLTVNSTWLCGGCRAWPNRLKIGDAGLKISRMGHPVPQGSVGSNPTPRIFLLI